MQSKHLTTSEKIERKQEETFISLGKEQLKKTPTWLIDNLAKKEFKRIVKEFDKIDTIGNLDLNNVACYCNAYSFYRKVTENLKDQPLTIEKILPNGSCCIAENPLIKIQKNYADEMRKFAGLVGLTIDSRLKMATTKTTKEKEDIMEIFGDI